MHIGFSKRMRKYIHTCILYNNSIYANNIYVYSLERLAGGLERIKVEQIGPMQISFIEYIPGISPTYTSLKLKTKSNREGWCKMKRWKKIFLCNNEVSSDYWRKARERKSKNGCRDSETKEQDSFANVQHRIHMWLHEKKSVHNTCI